MSITHLKKQARNLQQLLPAHLLEHPGGSSLTACQNLVAKTHGYPSFHAASSHLAVNGSEQRSRKQNSAAQVLCGLFKDAHDLKLRVEIIDSNFDKNQDIDHSEERIWLNRAIQFVKLISPLILNCVVTNQKIETGFFYAPNMERLVESFTSKEFDWVSLPLNQLLNNLPGYRPSSQRNGAQICSNTCDYLGYITMLIPSTRNILHPSEGRVNNDDGAHQIDSPNSQSGVW